MHFVGHNEPLYKMIMKKLIANNIKPFEPTHPGELLKDELNYREITQKRFASMIDMPYTALNEIINGKRSVSTEFAMILEAALGIEAHIWLNLQSEYNYQIASRDNKIAAKLDNIRKICAVL